MCYYVGQFDYDVLVGEMQYYRHVLVADISISVLHLFSHKNGFKNINVSRKNNNLTHFFVIQFYRVVYFKHANFRFREARFSLIDRNFEFFVHLFV